MMNCPHCDKINQKEATKCECGYRFSGYKEKVAIDVQSDNKVVVTDIKMKFGSMVEFMVKMTIASIPALVILFFIGVLFLIIFGGFITTF